MEQAWCENMVGFLESSHICIAIQIKPYRRYDILIQKKLKECSQGNDKVVPETEWKELAATKFNFFDFNPQVVYGCVHMYL